MVGRSKSYNEFMAVKFEDLTFAQTYLKLVLNEGVELDEALRSTIRNMGIKAFADKSGLSLQAVSDFVANRQSWSTDKMAKHILQVFNLKMKVAFEVAS